MPYGYIQQTGAEVSGSSPTSIATPNFGSSNTQGNFLFWCVFYQHTGAVTVTPSDTLGNVYTTIASSVVSSNACYAYGYVKNCKAGTNAVTCNFSAAVTAINLAALEYSGIDPFNPFVLGESAILRQVTPATTTDTVTSGNTPTLARSGCLLIGINNELNIGATPPTVGTGFTDRGAITGWSADPGRIEDRRLTGTAAVAATFTSNDASEIYFTLGAVFSETLPIAWPVLSRQHPGRGPGRRFFSSPKAYAVTSIGVLAGTDGLTFGQSGTLTGSGALAGTAALTLGQSGTLKGAGVLAGSAALTLGQSGALSGAGTLAGSSALTFGQTGAVSATGVLAGSSALTFGQTGSLAGAGALSGSSALTLGQTGALTGAGSLAGVSALVFGATGTLDQPSGAIQGTTALTLGASGTLTASGTLSGIATMLLDAFGTLDQPFTGIVQPGPVDSPRMAEGFYRTKGRRRRKKGLPELPEPVFISPASFEHAPPQAVIDLVPDFTHLAQRLGAEPAALSRQIDVEIARLMAEQAERDDEEALVLILTALDD